MPKDIEGSLFFTIPEVAKELHKSPAIINAYIRQGRLKSVRIGMNRLISIQELRRYQSRVLGFKK